MSSTPFPGGKLPNDSAIAIAVSVILPASATTAVLLSLYAQRKKGVNVTLDTKFLMAALAVAIGLSILTIYGAAAGGIGWPETFQAQFASKGSTIRFGHQILWGTSIQLVRIGLLLLYWRLFTLGYFRIAITIMLALSTVFYVGFMGLMTALFIIAPNQRGQAIDFPAVLIATAAVSLAMDVATLCFPLFVIKNLNITTKKKIYLVGIFGLGVFCIISSVVRMSYFVELRANVQNQNPASKTVYHITLWSLIEPFTSIIAACLPTCATLLKDKQIAPSKIISRVTTGLKGQSRSNTFHSQHSDGLPMHSFQPQKANHSYQGSYTNQHFPGQQNQYNRY